jgi:hypothetical protein
MLNHFFKIFQVFVFAVIALQVHSQTVVYTNAVENDTINKAIKDFFAQLGKAGFSDYRLAASSAFLKKGILILKTDEADKQKIGFPPKLSQYGPEGLYIKADDRSAVIIGNTSLAVQQALYFYLEQLGFRYLLPGEIWEQIPILKSIYKKTELLTRPDYDWRSIANGHAYANSKKIENDFKTWEKANRMAGSFPVNNGHSYDEIMLNNAAVFKNHPEYFAGTFVKGTLPPAPKFNVANKDLVKLVAEDAVKRLETYKKLGWPTNMVSMEPSDGGGFCNTPACLAIGKPSDQAFYLTNAAAKEVQKKFPGSWVGSYAYNEHVVPTKYILEPNVFVMIANGFNRSKYSTEELLGLWGKKTKKTGVYEYLHVYEGAMDMPGQMHIGNTKYLSQSIKKFYKAGATTYVGESTMGWVSKAVGNYTLARLLWDVNSDVEAIKKDFYQNAFGSVGSSMRIMMDQWETYPTQVPADNDLADWLHITDEAYKKATDKKIRQRIGHVKIYLHYMVLFRNLKRNITENDYIRIVTFANKTFETAAFATLPAMVSVGNYSGFKGRGWYDTPDQPWKKDKQPYTDAELEQFFQEDLRTIKKIEGITKFKPSSSFRKLSDLVKLPAKSFEKSGIGYWGNNEFIIQVEKKSENNFIEIISGHSASPPVDRYVKISVYKIDDAKKENPLLMYSQEKKLVNEKFSLASLAPGYYRLRVADEQKMFILKFSAGINYSIVIRAEEKLLTATIAGYNTFYFYVPAGIKRFQMSKTVSLHLESPSGRIINMEGGQEETKVIDVQSGETGIWKIFKQSGSLFIVGLPPYLGAHPSTMLVPADMKK